MQATVIAMQGRSLPPLFEKRPQTMRTLLGRIYTKREYPKRLSACTASKTSMGWVEQI
jgi:hypothetical protein